MVFHTISVALRNAELTGSLKKPSRTFARNGGDFIFSVLRQKFFSVVTGGEAGI